MTTELRSPDYEDTFSIPCPPGITMSDVIMASLKSTPGFVKVLLNARDSIVSRLGLKTGESIGPIEPSQIKSGAKVGPLEIGELTHSKVIVGMDDTHLDFRMIATIQGSVLNCTTQVRFNNKFGRLYFLVIKPFHIVIVPSMLRATINALDQT
jgi:hypothetical protein